MQRAAACRTIDAEPQSGVTGTAALLRQKTGDNGGVFRRLLQKTAGERKLLPDVGVIVGGAVAAARTDNGGKLPGKQPAGAPFSSGKGESVADQPVHDDLREGAVADAVEVNAEGLLHMTDRPLEVVVGLCLSGAGGFDIDLIITALMAGGEL